MDHIREDIINCIKCPLHVGRKNAVPGVGSENAHIMFIGEAPGENEDIKGIPFCGASGSFLDQLLSSINLKRDDVFITNIVKCRPPGNRDPAPIEISTCKDYLQRQISLISPVVICTLGRFSMNYFFPTFYISKVHGKIFDFDKYKIVPMYHPAVALYNNGMKEILLNDFKILKQFI